MAGRKRSQPEGEVLTLQLWVRSLLEAETTFRKLLALDKMTCFLEEEK